MVSPRLFSQEQSGISTPQQETSCPNLGQPSDQRDLLEADPLYLDWVGRIRCYGRLRGLQGRVFGDKEGSRVASNPLSTHPRGNGPTIGYVLQGAPLDLI